MQYLPPMTARTLLTCLLTGVCIALLAAPVNAEAETIYIADGGYYTAGPFPTYWTTGHMWVNMTVDGNGSVDVYVMSATQYFNSYSPYSDNASAPLAVSYQNSSVENTGSTSIHYQWNNSDTTYETTYSEIYVVIDNRNCTLTSGDASPTGPVTVRLDIDTMADYYSDISMEGLGLVLLMVVASPIIMIIIVVVIIAVASKKSNNSQPMPPPYYYPVMPPQPPQPPSTGK